MTNTVNNRYYNELFFLRTKLPYIHLSQALIKIYNTLRKNKVFLLLYGLLLLLGIFLLISFQKPEIILFINQHNNNYIDVFFTYITKLGEAPIVVFTLLFVLIKQRSDFWRIAIAFSVMGIFMYLCKFHFFEDNVRPRAFINNDKLLHFIQGVEMHLRHTFPSGHTTTAFLSFFLLSSFTKNKYIIFLNLALAASVAYSRMYLGQHFFEDVFVGSFVGVMIGVIALSFSTKLKKS